MDIFLYDNKNNSLILNEHQILLIKEFKALWDLKRNQCKEDPKGIERLRAFREFTYMYLTLDYKSPYFQYLEQEKHKAALEDAKLTEEEAKDKLFVAAFEKYQEIQNSDRVLSLIKTGLRTLTKTQIFLDSIDFNNDVDDTGRPIYKPKDVIADIGSIAKMRDQLLELEVTHKKGLSAASKVRGDAEIGFGEM
ncbi:MAG: hypothetical protein J6V44_11855 [Methanobrevibacter sp.]|nr:hypothetical protein [Methanobrevibacter sp.]